VRFEQQDIASAPNARLTNQDLASLLVHRILVCTGTVCGTAVGFAIPASAVAVSYLGGKAIYSRCKAETPQTEEDGRAKL